MIWVSPTGSWKIRSDKMGNGTFRAIRTKFEDGRNISYEHQGIDLECTPGQPIQAICDEFEIIRISYPYKDYFDLRGIIFRTSWGSGKMFYLNPLNDAIGKTFGMGEVIGFAEDLRIKYGNGMTPHVHLQFDNINPMVL